MYGLGESTCDENTLPSLREVASIEDLKLGTIYADITLLMKDRGREAVRWKNVIGSFHWKTDLPTYCEATKSPATCAGPVFVRTFPSGQTVTMGMHTDSRVIHFTLGSSANGEPVFYHPQALRECDHRS